MQSLTLEFNNERDFLSIIELIRKTDWIGKIRIQKAKAVKRKLPISSGDASVNPEELFGIWKGRNLTKEKLREISWGGRA